MPFVLENLFFRCYSLLVVPDSNAKPPVLPARPVQVEVVPGSNRTPPSAQDQPPIHAFSALILVGVDNLWNLADWAAITWVVTMPLSFLTVFVPVYLIQRHVRRDSRARALAFGVFLGVLAAVPTSITGTPVGLGLLAWTGLRRFLGPTSSVRSLI